MKVYELLKRNSRKRLFDKGSCKANDCSMKFNSILIVTYGRTGSTLLMGLLNAIPGVLVRGENMNICFGLYKAWQSIRGTQKQESTLESTHPFFGGAEMDEAGFIHDARNLIKRQLVPSSRQDIHCWGFKEIRYLSDSLGGTANLGSYLDFLDALMPEPAFIILTRNHADTITSGFWRRWAGREDIVRRRISDFENEAFAWMQGRENAFHVDYNDIVALNERFRDLYDFLGAGFDVDVISRILDKPHSVENRSTPVRPIHPLDIEYTARDNLATVRIDDDVLSSTPFHSQITLRGVVVVQSSQSGQFSLISVDEAGKHPVKWGIDSPKFASMFPENPHARRARFLVDGLRISPDEPIELYLTNGEGRSELLCRLTMPNAME